MLFLLVAYALSAGNAGTGFRYRTGLVTLAIAMMAILREQARRRRLERRTPVPVETDHVDLPAPAVGVPSAV
jgi:hypothetical protein